MKMKQLKVILLLLLFVHSKMGMALNFHYCGDHLAEVSFAFSPKGCGMEKIKKESSNTLEFSKKSCCLDDIQVFQSAEDITLSNEANGLVLDYLSPSLQNEFIAPNLFSCFIIEQNCLPPPITSSLFKLYSSFVFYE